MTEWIPFEAKISLQIFLGSIAQRDLSAQRQQDRTMKDHDQRREYSKRHYRATQPLPVPLRVCLRVFGHQGDCISTLIKSKANHGVVSKW